MNDKQENIFSMCLRVETRLDNNLTIVNSLPAFATARTNFKTRIANIRTTDIIATTPHTGVTEDKEAVRLNLVTACIQQSSALCAYATDNSNNTLYNEAYKSESDIKRLRDDQLPTYASLIAQRQTDHLASLAGYGVTAASITAFQDLITLYTTASPLPRSAISTSKAAKESLKTQIKDISAYLKKVVDKLVLTFKTTEPGFVAQYFNDRNIYDDGSSGSETILATVQNTIAIASTSNAGPYPPGTQKIRMTVITNGPLEFGLSTDGLMHNGNTTTSTAPGITTYALADFASAGNIMLVRNQNMAQSGEYKIEFLA